MVPPVWTLSVEVGFYVVLPLSRVRYFRHPIVGLLVAAGIVLGWTALATMRSRRGCFRLRYEPGVAQRIDTFYASQFPSWMLALAAGMTGAWVYVRLRDRFAAGAARTPGRPGHGNRRDPRSPSHLFRGNGAVDDPAPFEGLFARESLLLTLGYRS